MAQRGNLTKNSKHIEIHYHFIKKNYRKGVIDIIPIDSDENTADLFTNIRITFLVNGQSKQHWS